MCVIIIAETQRPTPKFLAAAAKVNPDGAGIAYRHGKDTKAVHYRKGLDTQAIIDLAETVDLPFVIHFRIQTVGGTNDALCHPFALGGGVSTKGRTPAALFHNGHWSGWQEHALRALTANKEPVGDAPWSDSRAMAFLAGRYGLGALDLIDDRQKIAVLTPTTLIRKGQGWIKTSGLYLSNDRGLTDGFTLYPKKRRDTLTLENGDEVDIYDYNQPRLGFSPGTRRWVG